MTDAALDDTLRRQRLASAPDTSAWVSANAGSGKTHVLAVRVVRLLLSGVDPARILCLTFTKAAAALMSRRVFDMLGGWIALDDETLAKEINKMEGAPPGKTRLLRARRLFAEALETPGGLKIQTLHGFCEAILHQFPIEARVAGHFEVFDDLAAAEAMRVAEDEVLVAAAEDPGSPLGRAFAEVVARTSESGVTAVLREAVAARDDLRLWFDAEEPYRTAAMGDDPLATVAARLRSSLGLGPTETTETVEAAFLPSPHFDAAFLARLLPVLEASDKPTDTELAADFRKFAAMTVPAERIEAWLDLFFRSGHDEPRATSRFGTKAVKATVPDLEARFAAEAARLEALLDKRRSLSALTGTIALLRLADAVIDRYERAKTLAGALDFEDLIVRTATLLSRSDAAAWVQYKLDKGIDHVLVDEAQDTSPRQWQVIRSLTAEFFAGEGRAGAGTRTLFAVGDEKQSIYSFQGAEPGAFDAERRRVRGATAGVAKFELVQLALSFRSTDDVLGAVDRVVEANGLMSHLVADPADYTSHTARRLGEAGAVEVWAPSVAVAAEEPEDWTAPPDAVDRRNHVLALADRIARTVAGWIASGERLERTKAPIRAGDCLILVRKRGAIVEALTRALKRHGVPVAGADRLRLGAHVAVMDLVALGQVALLPEDDLSLAALLKSPLLGVDEEALFRLAHARPGSLAAALEAVGDDEPTLATARDRLRRWRAGADRARPFEFFARVLGPEGGRAAFLARLGPEAEDVLDEFLAAALAHERAGPSTLAGFLATLAAADTDIKRETEAGRDEVRVMTVHGAKGLEAPVVIVVDDGGRPVDAGKRPALTELAPAFADAGDGPTPAPRVWAPSERPRVVRDAQKRADDAAYSEYLRLLYVAMTRAEDRLVVCGLEGLKKSSGPERKTWRRLVEEALVSDVARVEPIVTDDTTVGWRWRRVPPRPVPAASGDVVEATPDPVAPDWFGRPPPVETPPLLVAPSAVERLAEDAPEALPAVNALDAAEGTERFAIARGRAVHRLLEILPGVAPERRGTAAAALAARLLAEADPADRARAVAEALAILADPRFAAVFGPSSRAEVAVVGHLRVAGREARLGGRIDRLVVEADRVVVVDYKTNRPAPADLDAVPSEHLTQMAAYAAVLLDLYPGRRIEAGLLYTAAPRLVAVPPERLLAVLDAITAGVART